MRVFQARRMAALLLAACAGAAPAAAAPANPAPVAAPLPPQLPLRRDAAPASEPWGWSPSAALLAMAGGAGAFVLWRRGRGRPSSQRAEGGRVQRLSSQALTPQASVHAVQWHGEEFLLACTAQQVTLLGRRPAPPQPGEPS